MHSIVKQYLFLYALTYTTTKTGYVAGSLISSQIFNGHSRTLLQTGNRNTLIHECWPNGATTCRPWFEASLTNRTRVNSPSCINNILDKTKGTTCSVPTPFVMVLPLPYLVSLGMVNLEYTTNNQTSTIGMQVWLDTVDRVGKFQFINCYNFSSSTVHHSHQNCQGHYTTAVRLVTLNTSTTVVLDEIQVTRHIYTTGGGYWVQAAYICRQNFTRRMSSGTAGSCYSNTSDKTVFTYNYTEHPDCIPSCSSGTYNTRNCTTNLQRICTNCTPNNFCTGGYHIASCTAACQPGTYETIACTASTNRVCTACPIGSFCLGGNHTANCTVSCPAGTYETNATCTSTANKVCSVCLPQSFCLGGTHIANCTVPCLAGTYETTACTSLTNRVCTPCPAGSFCLGGNHIANCTARCPVGLHETTTCSSTNDTTCVSFITN